MLVGSTRHTWLRGWLAAKEELLSKDTLAAAQLSKEVDALVRVRQLEYDLLTKKESLE